MQLHLCFRTNPADGSDLAGSVTKLWICDRCPMRTGAARSNLVAVGDQHHMPGIADDRLRHLDLAIVKSSRAPSSSIAEAPITA